MAHVIGVIGDEPFLYAKDDSDTVYGYDDRDEAKENHHRVIVQKTAIRLMLEGNQTEFEREWKC